MTNEGYEGDKGSWKSVRGLYEGVPGAARLRATRDGEPARGRGGRGQSRARSNSAKPYLSACGVHGCASGAPAEVGGVNCAPGGEAWEGGGDEGRVRTAFGRKCARAEGARAYRALLRAVAETAVAATTVAATTVAAASAAMVTMVVVTAVVMLAAVVARAGAGAAGGGGARRRGRRRRRRRWAWRRRRRRRRQSAAAHEA